MATRLRLVENAPYIADHAHQDALRNNDRSRVMRTFLTDDHFADLGLDVIADPYSAKTTGEAIFVERDDTVGNDAGDLLLIKRPANDRLDMLGQPGWLGDLKGRVDALRELAEEEGETLDEASADAALAFAARLIAARRPGAFLVNGNIRLLWDSEGGQQVGLQFRGGEKIQFVIFQRDGGDLGSLMGTRSTEAVYAMITAPEIFPLLSFAR